jgi:hypothetical protein
VEENLEELIKTFIEKEQKELSEFLDFHLERELRALAEATAKELEELEELEKIINPCPLNPENRDTEKPS